MNIYIHKLFHHFDVSIKFIKNRCPNLRIFHIFINTITYYNILNTIYNIFIKINQYYY